MKMMTKIQKIGNNNMMNASKFLPAPTDTFTIPFKLEEDFLLNWLADLLRCDGGQACSKTLSFLHALNKIELYFSERFNFLRLINEYLKGYINKLDGACWDASFPLSQKENVYAQMVTWNHLALAQGFFMAAQAANKKNDVILALAMALHALGQAQLHIAATYLIPSKGFWHLLYQIFIWAEKRKLIDLPIDNSDFKGLTLNTLFMRSLIFQLCDTNQFHSKEMRVIFNFLPKVCSDLPIAIYFNDSRGLFIVDLKSDSPPLNIKAQVELGSDLVRYFSPVNVANTLNHIIEQGETWSGTLKSINNTLFTRVANTLGLQQKRRYHRRQESYSLLGVIGFEDIIVFLYKATRNNFIELPPVIQKPANHSQLPNPAIDKHTKGELAFLKEESSLIKQKPALVKKQIWDYSKSVVEIPMKRVSLKEIKVCDSSANGYSVSWNQDYTKARIGDLFGIISEDKKRLEIAIIRRIALSAGSDFKSDLRFGAEVLGFESELVQISSAEHENISAWGVFVPGIEVLNRPYALIYSVGHFTIGETVKIYKGNKIISALLLKELHSTVAISHVELYYPK